MRSLKKMRKMRRFSKEHEDLDLDLDTPVDFDNISTEMKIKVFEKVLSDASDALKSAKIPFHLHSGTALGAIRSGCVIPNENDNDIDLAIFPQDYKRSLKRSMFNHNFVSCSQHGLLKFGKEYTFRHKLGVNVDIFFVYYDKDIDKFWVASFFGPCDEKKYKFCRWAYRPYDVVDTKINGKSYKSMPESALFDAYGKNWKVPKKFGYFEGLEDDTLYTNLIDE